MKLTMEDLKRLQEEMEENEEMMRQMYLSIGTENEDAGDRQ